MKKLSLVFTIITVGFFIWLGHSQENAATKDNELMLPQVGHRTQSFSLKNFNGHMVNLDDYKGKPVLLNFWASWCPPCRVEMPHLINVYSQYSNQVDFVGIHMAHQDRQDAAIEFLSTYNVPYDNLIDEYGQVARQFQVTAFPTTVVIDHQGVIVYRESEG